MIFPQPHDHLFAQLSGEGRQFPSFLRAHLSGRIVFGRVSLRAARVQIIGIGLPFLSKNQ